VLTQKIIEKEFALSGSEQNPDLTGKSVREVLKRALPGAPGPVEAFKEHGVDFVVERDLGALVKGMNALTGEGLVEEAALRREIEARDREIANTYTKDLQVTAIRGARNYLGDKLIRTASPHRLLDPKAGPLIAVRLNILTRKSLGGLETDLDGRVLAAGLSTAGGGAGESGEAGGISGDGDSGAEGRGEPLAGLYAAGEAAGFGGGGMHGYRSLEGTFLGGCIFSGRTAGRAAAQATA